MPKRIQRKRTKGWRMPEGAVYVGRPTEWGNLFIVGEAFDNLAAYIAIEGTQTPEQIEAWYERGGLPIPDAEAACQWFRKYATWRRAVEPEWLEPLRGKDLACWCRLDQPCHADVLLELANGGAL